MLVTDTSVNIAGDLTVTGGDITLSGTGRIQGVDTVSVNTDAANKLYVDNAVAAVPGTVTSVATTSPILGGTITSSGTISLLTPQNGDWWNGGAVVVGTDGVAEVGKYFDMHATDTATSDYDVRLTASTGSLAISGDLVVSGGDITLSGTGRIQGIDTVSAGTDAVNKDYVDNNFVADADTLWSFDADGAGTAQTVTVGNSVWFEGTNGITFGSGTGPVGFDHQVSASLDTTGVTAGGYTSANITVDAYGRITAASSGGGGLSGSGTTNYIPKFTGSTAIGNSSFYESGDDLYIPNYIYHIGATDDFFGFPIGGRFSIYVGNSEQIRIIDTGTTVNNAFGTSGPATFGDTLKYSTPTGTSAVFNGEIVDFGGIAGAVTTGDLVVLRHNLGSPQWSQADYNSFLNATGMLGIYDGTNVLVRGFVQDPSFSFTTSGAPLYMGVTGGISTSAPTASGDYVRIIGYVADAANDRIYFCPDNTWVLI